MFLIASVAIIMSLFFFLSRGSLSSDTIHVARGETLPEIAKELKEKNVIRSEKSFRFFMSLFASGRKIVTGDYLIEAGTSVFRVAWMLSHGMHNVDPLKITLREGLTNAEMSDILAEKLSAFDPDEFGAETAQSQGYLFPDTYFFYRLSTTQEVIETLKNTFIQRTASLKHSLAESRYTEKEILSMAAIIEKEARGDGDSHAISGILWKRFDLGMPLQVDAAPETYTAKGLPVRPITNPGLSAITAALRPSSTDYLFYLHDKTGMIHFARTYAEHKRNIDTYLR